MAKYSSIGSSPCLEYLSGTAYIVLEIPEAKIARLILTHVEHLNVVKDMIVVGKVVGRDDIDTGILLDLPVLETESLSLSEQVLSGQLVSPVSLVGLLQVAETSHAGETQDRRPNHDDGLE